MRRKGKIHSSSRVDSISALTCTWRVQDNEVYRATLRTQIREWLDSITAKRHQEWLIVHVTSGRGSGGKFYQRKGTIVDKIKADFNVGKRDRSVASSSSSFPLTTYLRFVLSAAASKSYKVLRQMTRHRGPTFSPR